MNEGKKERVKVRTIHASYTGNLFIPAQRKRFSDVIYEPDMVYINLTDVEADETPEKIKNLP